MEMVFENLLRVQVGSVLIEGKRRNLARCFSKNKIRKTKHAARKKVKNKKRSKTQMKVMEFTDNFAPK